MISLTMSHSGRRCPERDQGRWHRPFDATWFGEVPYECTPEILSGAPNPECDIVKLVSSHANPKPGSIGIQRVNTQSLAELPHRGILLGEQIASG